LCDFIYLFIYFSGTNVGEDPWTDFDAQWLKRREIGQRCAFLGL